VIRDPNERGRRLAAVYLDLAPRLWRDLVESGVLPTASLESGRDEWNAFALYACVRGLVAAGGFNRETAAAVDALHAAVLEAWDAGEADAGRRRALRALVAERYAEYGAIGQAGGASGAATVTTRLGDAAARHLTGTDSPTVAELVGGLHESMVEGATESVRSTDL
jgi:hypothetical protein